MDSVLNIGQVYIAVYFQTTIFRCHKCNNNLFGTRFCLMSHFFICPADESVIRVRVGWECSQCDMEGGYSDAQGRGNVDMS
jgi:hypothetical protein